MKHTPTNNKSKKATKKTTAVRRRITKKLKSLKPIYASMEEAYPDDEVRGHELYGLPFYKQDCIRQNAAFQRVAIYCNHIQLSRYMGGFDNFTFEKHMFI